MRWHPGSCVTCVLLVLAGLLAGCARYERRLVEPSAFAAVITRDPYTVAIPPLEYEMADYGRQLALRIHNPTGTAVKLLGDRSYIVDPSGETQPLRGGVVAPGSYISLGLPPMTRVMRTGPRFSVGVGTGFYGSHTGYYGGLMGDPFGPPYSSAYATDVPYWRWVEGQVRMHLAIEQDGREFDHALVFDRTRLK